MLISKFGANDSVPLPGRTASLVNVPGPFFQTNKPVRGGATRAHDRDQLERLCRYITRPAVSTKRLSLTRHGKVRYELKTPYSDGTTHVLFEPLDFISRLVALVPKPRVNLTRFHVVFAPNSKYRARVTLAKQEEAEGPLWVVSSYR